MQPVFKVRTFGDPVLKQRAHDVTDIDGALVRVIDAMFETMYEARGLGLAAPQVAIAKRLFTYDIDDDPKVLVNPEIVDSSGEWTYDEGCLSVPGMSFELVRPKLVTVKALDLDGNDVVIEADELLARLYLHEIDHLDGVLLLDRLEPEVRREALRAMRERDFAAPTEPRADPGDDEHRL